MRRNRRFKDGKFGVVAVLALGLMALSSFDVHAQPAGIDPGKDCHTIRTCNFGRGGAYRGCISAYSCKQCRFVSAPCTVDGRRKVCQRLRCGWGPA